MPTTLYPPGAAYGSALARWLPKEYDGRLSGPTLRFRLCEYRNNRPPSANPFALTYAPSGQFVSRSLGDRRKLCYPSAEHQSPQGGYAMPERRNWSAIIDRLNTSKKGNLSIRMGSAGSAQVTRVRLLEQWNNLEVNTVGRTLHLRLAGRR